MTSVPVPRRPLSSLALVLASLLVPACGPRVASPAGSAQPARTQPALWPAGTLIVSNMSDGTATLLDAATGVARATLSTGADPHEVAASADGAWAVVTLQGRNRVVWLDLSRGTLVRSAPTGTWSDGIAFAPSPGT